MISVYSVSELRSFKVYKVIELFNFLDALQIFSYWNENAGSLVFSGILLSIHNIWTICIMQSDLRKIRLVPDIPVREYGVGSVYM